MALSDAPLPRITGYTVSPGIKGMGSERCCPTRVSARCVNPPFIRFSLLPLGASSGAHRGTTSLRPFPADLAPNLPHLLPFTVPVPGRPSAPHQLGTRLRPGHHQRRRGLRPPFHRPRLTPVGAVPH